MTVKTRPTESVWDYPRPPRLEPVPERLTVLFAGRFFAETTRAYRVLETSHPPVYYFPPEDVDTRVLTPAAGATWCEFKGQAQYWTLEIGARRSERAAWSYPEPAAGYRAIAGYFAFYADRVDQAWVGTDQVRPQESAFYGGWITDRITGPFKGPPGTRFW
ncbi:MAG: DUF427 domain-containing protein [Paracoccaceae bacterium]